MDIQGKVAIITGGASGIGAGLAERFAADGARGIVVADLHLAQAEGVAAAINADGQNRALALRCDVSVEADIQALVAATRARFGQVDLYISNAGIGGGSGGFDVADPVWDKMWLVHGMAHVWAARAVVPEMAERGEGGFVVTASAAGLLNIVESAPYAVTKHAAVAFAEWLRIGYGRRGVRVACLCPQGVATAMTAGGAGSAAVDGMLSAGPGGGRRGGGPARRDLSGAAAPRGAGLPARQDRQLRPLAGGHAEALCQAGNAGQDQNSTMITLYDCSTAPSPRRARILLAEKGVAARHGADRPAQRRATGRRPFAPSTRSAPCPRCAPTRAWC